MNSLFKKHFFLSLFKKKQPVLLFILNYLYRLLKKNFLIFYILSYLISCFLPVTCNNSYKKEKKPFEELDICKEEGKPIENKEISTSTESLSIEDSDEDWGPEKLEELLTRFQQYYHSPIKNPKDMEQLIKEFEEYYFRQILKNRLSQNKISQSNSSSNCGSVNETSSSQSNSYVEFSNFDSSNEIFRDKLTYNFSSMEKMFEFIYDELSQIFHILIDYINAFYQLVYDFSAIIYLLKNEYLLFFLIFVFILTTLIIGVSYFFYKYYLNIKK